MLKYLRRVVAWLVAMVAERQPKDDDARRLFHYFDGMRGRTADPIEVYEALERGCGCDPSTLLQTLVTDPPVPPPGVNATKVAAEFQQLRDKAGQKLAEAALGAFGVQPYTEGKGGLTRSERVALVVEFLAYLGGVAVAVRPFTNSPSPTAESPPASPTSN